MTVAITKTKVGIVLALLLCNAVAWLIVARVAFTKYAGRTIASIQLGRENKQNGIRWCEVLKDGRTEATEIGGSECRVARRPKGPGYIYFTVDSFLKQGKLMDTLVTVDYFDFAPGEFALNYDAVDVDQNKASPYLMASQKEKCTGSQQWRRAYFIARNARFKNSQNGGADFRIELRVPELYVRRVTVQRLNTVLP